MPEDLPLNTLFRCVACSPDASTQVEQLGRIRIRTESGSQHANVSRSSSLSRRENDYTMSLVDLRPELFFSRTLKTAIPLLDTTQPIMEQRR